MPLAETTISILVGMAKSLGLKAAENALATILPSDFSAQLDGIASDWRKSLPESLRNGLNENAILRGLRVDTKGAGWEQEANCWAQVHNKLFECIEVPTDDDWYECLVSRCNFAKSPSSDAFFASDPQTLAPYLNRLAGKLSAVCASKISLLGPTLVRGQQNISDQLSTLTEKFDRQEDKSAHGRMIDFAKQQFETFEFELADKSLKALETDSWEFLTDIDRFKLLSLQAAIKFRQDLQAEAGALFIKAKRFAPTEEKALCNEALGYEMIGEREKALSLADPLRAEFPLNGKLWGVWLRSSPENFETEELFNAASLTLRRDPDFLLAAITRATRVDKDDELAASYIEQLASKSPDLPVSCLLLSQVRHRRAWAILDPSPREVALREALALYEQTAEAAKKRRDDHVRAIAIVNQGIIKDHFKESGTLTLYKEAAELAPNDFAITRKYVLAKIEGEEYDEAIKQAEDAFRQIPSDETAHFLAMLLAQRDREDDRNRAVEVCSAFIFSDTDSGDECLQISITMLAAKGDMRGVEELLSKASDRLSGLSVATLRSIACSELGETEKAIEYAKVGFGLLSGNEKPFDRHRLAHQLLRVEQYPEAVKVFLMLVRKGVLDDDMYGLIRAAEKTQKHDVLMRIYRELRETGSSRPSMRQNEFVLLLTYNPAEGIELYQRELASHPDDNVSRLYLSALALRLGKRDLVCTAQDKIPGVEEDIPTHLACLAIHILAEGGNPELAVRHAYELVRGRYDDIHAHRALIFTMMRRAIRSSKLSILESPSSAQVGSSVEIEEPDGSKRWFTIEDGPKPSAARGEFPPHHFLSKEMLGKRVGDAVLLTESAIQARSGKVVSIASKFVHLYQQLLHNFQILFPEATDVQMFSVSGGDGADKYDFTVIRDYIKRNNEAIERIVGLYPDNPIPLATLSGRLGRELFDVMSHLLDLKGKKIACCDGTVEEREDATESLRSSLPLVIDATAVFSLVLLGRIRLLAGLQVRPIVSQATFQLLQDYVAENEGGEEKGRLCVNRRGDFYIQPFNEEQLERYLDKWRTAIDAIKQYCDIVACSELPAIETEERESLVDLFGQHGAESMLLAKDGILWTDDVFLSVFARSRFGVRRVWTQAVLSEWADSGRFARSEFNSDSARLFGCGYNFTWWNVDIFVEAANAAQWMPSHPMLSELVADLRNSNIAYEVRLMFAFQVVIRSLQYLDRPVDRNRTIIAVLRSVSTWHDPTDVFRNFMYAAKKLHRGNAALIGELRAILRIWLNDIDGGDGYSSADIVICQLPGS